VESGPGATGVSASEVDPGIRAVNVTAGSPKDVGVVGVSFDEEQAASRIKPDRSMGTSFMFMVLFLTIIINLFE
jgi:hypothetical protein